MNFYQYSPESSSLAKLWDNPIHIHGISYHLGGKHILLLVNPINSKEPNNIIQSVTLQ